MQFDGISVVGAVNYDLKGISIDSFLNGTSNPGTAVMTPGGVGRNIAENIARIGLPVKLFGRCGTMGAGIDLITRTADSGVDVISIDTPVDLGPGMYISLHDKDGRLVGGVSDMRAADTCTPEIMESKIPRLVQSQLIIADANLPVDTLKLIAETAAGAGIPFIMEPVSVKKAEKILQLDAPITYATPNLEEYEVLKCAELPNLEWFIITAGSAGVILKNNRTGEEKILPALDCSPVDVTGAGDAFTAGFACGLVMGMDIEEAAELGQAASKITLETDRSVSLKISMAGMLEILRR